MISSEEMALRDRINQLLIIVNDQDNKIESITTENEDLKAYISDLKQEISGLYEQLKERIA